ncbi:MAG: hypothetical protein HQK53_07270 [Oligoflexia bacterium]|nr:hypothetical protein [Oligoflexia bacterium]
MDVVSDCVRKTLKDFKRLYFRRDDMGFGSHVGLLDMKHVALWLTIWLVFILLIGNVGTAIGSSERKGSGEACTGETCAIDRDIKILNERLEQLRRHKSQLEEYSRVADDHLNTLRSSIANMDREQGEIVRGVQNVGATITRLRTTKEQHEASIRALVRSNEQKESALSKILQEKFILQNIKNKLILENRSILYSKIKLETLISSSLSLKDAIDNLMAQYQAKISAHLEWIDRFKLLAIQYAPAYERITDLKTFGEENAKISQFQAQIPSDELVNNENKKYFRNLALVDVQITKLQSELQSFAGSAEMATLRQKTIADLPVPVPMLVGVDTVNILNDLKQRDVDLQNIRSLLIKSKKSLEELSRKRMYLVIHLPQSWKKIIDVRLIASSIQLAASGINEVDNALHANQLYADIRGALDPKLMNYSQHIRRKYCPRLARIDLYEAQDYLSSLQQAVPGLRLAPTLLSEVNVWLADYDVKIKNLRGVLLSDMDELDQFFSERKRQLTRKIRQVPDRLNDDCKQRINEYIQNATDSLDSEREYISILSDC